MERRHEYPVYIVSKGRHENPITAKQFAASGVDYKIVVEPQEEKQYVDALGKDKVIVLPFSNLGLGSYPARNFCWEHSVKNGHKMHWVFDDNIYGFCKWINAKKQKIQNIEAALLYVEAFAKKNKIDIAGFEYRYFSSKPPKRPFKINTHIYSAILIKNDLPYRWRLKYNEDVDLCLQILHGGGCTASCVYYLTNKVSTAAKLKGGNQDELYKGNAREKKILKAKMLEAQWPQYVKTVERFGRPHHFIDWKIFRSDKKIVVKSS